MIQAESQVNEDRISELSLVALLNWSFFIAKAGTLAIVDFSKGR